MRDNKWEWEGLDSFVFFHDNCMVWHFSKPRLCEYVWRSFSINDKASAWRRLWLLACIGQGIWNRKGCLIDSIHGKPVYYELLGINKFSWIYHVFADYVGLLEHKVHPFLLTASFQQLLILSAMPEVYIQSALHVKSSRVKSTNES